MISLITHELSFNFYSGRIFILPALFLWVTCVQAQEKIKKPSKVWFHSIDKHPDFSPAYNYFVHRDSEDFVWISSTAGLNRYDGVRFKQYFSNPNDSTALLSDNIQSPFFEDADKNIWFSTTGSIQVYNRATDSFRSYFEQVGALGKTPASYRAFFLERDTFLWFKADHEIYRYNIYLPESSVQLIDTSDSYTMLVDADLDGSVKYLYGTGKLSNNKREYWEIKNGEVLNRKKWFSEKGYSPKSIYDICTAGNFSWLGTDKGLFLWDRKKDLIKMLDEQPVGDCYFTTYGKDSLLLWGEERGFQFFDKNARTVSNLEFRNFENELITSKEVGYIYVDRQRHIWLSFINDGLVYANPLKNKFESIPIFANDKLKADYTYTCFFVDDKDNFWYGTQTQGLFMVEKGTEKIFQYKRPFDPEGALHVNWVTGIEQDDKNNIWISTRYGMTLFNPRSRTLELIPSFSNNRTQGFLDLIKLKNGELIACTIDGDIFRIVQSNNTYRLQRILDTNQLFSGLYEDRYSNIYVSRNEKDIGVYEMKQDTLRLKYLIPLKGAVTGYSEQKENNKLWISSFLGLAKVDITSATIDTMLTKNTTFQNNSIHAMLRDKDGSFWLSTPKGLFNFIYSTDTSALRKFYLSDGTQSEKFHMHAAIKLKDGTLRFGGDKGLTNIKPSEIKISKYKPVIQLTDILFNDEPAVNLECQESGTTNISLIEKLTRKYVDNTVSFKFVGIDYSDPTSVQLSYKLKGEDKQWVNLKKGEPGFARYSNLKERSYKFLVRSINADGEAFSEEKLIEITILPPIYRNPWFLTLLSVVLLVIGYFFYHYRINQIKEKAELKTRALENKMAALRAQMNPHFIFNSLQTLSGLIVRKETKGSIEYVSQFAKLMRVILENSRLGSISLEKEIELLELYMNVESKRFKIPFTYSIKTSKELDTVKLLIPSMLLQPFVENSIKHGLFHQKKEGKIDIVFNKEDGLLKCVIEDNGIGRKQANELNSQQGRQHESRGLEIVRDRLRTFKNSDTNQFDFQIIDLYDRDKHAIGTRVEVLLPILMNENNET